MQDWNLFGECSTAASHTYNLVSLLTVQEIVNELTMKRFVLKLLSIYLNQVLQLFKRMCRNDVLILKKKN